MPDGESLSYRKLQADRGIDRNLKNPYSDSFSVAIEREIFTDFSLSLTGIYKESKDSIQNHAVCGCVEAFYIAGLHFLPLQAIPAG